MVEGFGYMKALADTFNLLKKRFPGYEDRPQQMEMAEEVFACLRKKKNLLVEAGTGVGKSVAYLIPAILSNEKTVVTTASIALQDQLINKDLDFLKEALPVKFTFAILKGKNNYLCFKRRREFHAELGNKSHKKFQNWASKTKTGDKDELPFLPYFWSSVCGDSDDCSSRQCPFFGECFYYRHYRSLYKKDILVVNHHLLVYDLISDSSLLPFHKQLIIDEAHQLENVISQVLGSALTHSRIVWLLYRLRGLKITVDHLFEPVSSFFKKGKIPLHPVCPIPDAIIEELKNLKGQLTLNKVIHRLNTYKELIADNEAKDRIATTINYVNSLKSVIYDFIEQTDKDRVYYMTGNSGSSRNDKNFLELKSRLVESQKHFNSLINAYDSVTMTSATLTAGGDFNFIRNRLGITGNESECVSMSESKGESERITRQYLQSKIKNRKLPFKEMVVGSPFDYKRQSLLYLDKELPSPVKESNEIFQKKGLKTIEGLINASKGRALVLFTSYSHLHFVSENINIEYPFKSQGDMPPPRLMEWFKETPNSVLLATATFWHGIDIKGEKLSLVVIVKMPFGLPGDPVYDERCKRLGERWFKDLALPSAILLLRQGFGRLIRGVNDYGVVAILDTRLLNSSYGQIIVSSLPNMDIVYHIENVKMFFDSMPQPASPKGVIPPGQKMRQCDTGNDKGISRVVALGNSKDPSVISELIDLTQSENGNERRLAASALGKLARFKPEIYKAVEALEVLLKDEKPQVRQYAMKTLARIGKVNQERFKSIINNSYENGYNVALAKNTSNPK